MPDLVTQTVAIVLTAAILWSLHVESHRAKPRPASEDPEVHLSLLEESTTPKDPTVEPPRSKSHKVHEASSHRIEHAIPIADVLAPNVAESPSAALAPVAAQPETPLPAESRASVEDRYAAALRQNVDSRTSVPSSAEYRLLRPAGTTHVRFVLDRVGNPSDVAVARSSGSGILDRQALNIVSSGHYPPFPETAYSGETRHIFIVTIEFRS